MTIERMKTVGADDAAAGCCCCCGGPCCGDCGGDLGCWQSVTWEQVRCAGYWRRTSWWSCRPATCSEAHPLRRRWWCGVVARSQGAQQPPQRAAPVPP